MIAKLTILAVIATASGLSLTENEIKCLEDETNQNVVSGDFLYGTWYHVCKFTLFPPPIPSSSCPENNFTKPSGPDEIQKYKDYYGTELPISFDEDPVDRKVPNGVDGMVFGSKQVKMFAVHPDSGFYKKYQVNVYKIVNENYIVFWECANPFTRWIWSRIHYPSDEDMEMLITLPDVDDLYPQRYCMP